APQPHRAHADAWLPPKWHKLHRKEPASWDQSLLGSTSLDGAASAVSPRDYSHQWTVHLPCCMTQMGLSLGHPNRDRQSYLPPAELLCRHYLASGMSFRRKNSAPGYKAEESRRPSLPSRETPPDSH